MAQRQSTVPFILNLDDLVKNQQPRRRSRMNKTSFYQTQPHFQSQDPFADSPTDDTPQDDQGLTRHRSPYAAQTTPDLTKTYNRGHGPGLGSSPKLLTPEAHQKLGRMSVATARYTLPPQRNRGKPRDSRSTTVGGRKVMIVMASHHFFPSLHRAAFT